MKSLIKVMLTLATVFATTFIVARATGILTIENIEIWLEAARALSPVYVVAIVIALLFADLFIAVPTLTVMLLAGFFLGHLTGFVAVVTGLVLAGTTGYALSRWYGDRILKWLVKDQEERESATRTFRTHGIVVILLSRAMPILPEVSACMSGITRIPFLQFLTAWLASIVPYSLIATYAGSVSTLDNPKPALFTAIGLTAFFWISWFVFSRYQVSSRST